MLLSTHDGPPRWVQVLFDCGRDVVKAAADSEPAYSLAGTLYLSESGWILLSVPNAFVRGVFSAMDEQGVELPPGPADGPFNAHISVFRKEELERIGGADKVTERGKQFSYRLGGLYSMTPDGWPGVSKVWYVRVHSPELMNLRKSYGLSALPGESQYDFHITVGIRRRGVLGATATSKSAA